MSLLLVPFQVDAAQLQIESKIMDGTTVEFLKFSGSGAWDNYLTMNLPFAPAEHLFNEVQNIEKLKLKNRGEAHITVITPVEYWNVLRLKNISMAEINAIAKKFKIQESKFSIKCLGAGKLLSQGEVLKTYFIVVESQDLLNIRNKIQELYISKGGLSTDFIPSNFYPHITLGFTVRDLHESDGVIKDSYSCIHDLVII